MASRKTTRGEGGKQPQQPVVGSPFVPPARAENVLAEGELSETEMEDVVGGLGLVPNPLTDGSNPRGEIGPSSMGPGGATTNSYRR